MSETPTETPVEPGEKPSEQGQTFTQADVDRIVKERIQRTKAAYADYDDLKARAEGAKTLEDRVAEFEAKYQAAETARLRSDVAAQFQIAPEDRDLFLTGADEGTLIAQAKRLSERESERKKNGNVAPREGTSPGGGATTSPWSGVLQAMDQARA